jgi:putative transposase
MVATPEQYPWSSYRIHIGHRSTPAWLKTDFILDYFGRKAPDAKNSYRRFVEALLDSAYESPLQATVASTV